MTSPEPAVALPEVVIKPGHVRPLYAGHPWVFAQAAERLPKGVEAGAEVVVRDSKGHALGRGLCSPGSAIPVRIYTRHAGQAIDAAYFVERLERAVAQRRASGLPDTRPGQETDGFRLLHGEGDGVPGLIVDAFGDVLAVQLGTAGLRLRQAAIVQALREVVGPRVILDRSPPPHRAEEIEGHEAAAGGAPLFGEAPEQLVFRERGLRYRLPAGLGQKTGYYFDQRPLRARVERFSRGCRVVDACCYVGSMALTALRGGATHVLAVDKSAPALEAAAQLAEDHQAGDKLELRRGDAAEVLLEVAAAGGADLVICDPPKLAGRGSSKRALDAYRRLASAACAATAPGGLLAFCSCSAAVSPQDLQRALALGARQVDRAVVVVDRCFQGSDHPVVAAFPEGLYLKVLLCRVYPR